MKALDMIKEEVKPIARQYGVKKAYLFGSYAKGTADENSDIDIMIEKGAPLSLLGLSGMRQTLQETLNMSVDLITTSGIDDEFYNSIKGTEVLIYEG